jgi:hypothetical protein
MSNPLMPLTDDQLIPVNKAVNEKEQLEKGGWRRRKTAHLFIRPMYSF